MLMSSLCDYCHAQIFVKGKIAVNNIGTAAAPNKKNIKVISKNCAPFSTCISEVNNTQIDNAKDIDIVMPMYNLTEYSDNYSKASGSLNKYCKDMQAGNNNCNIVKFNEANATDSFSFEAKTTGQTDHGGEINNAESNGSIKIFKQFMENP